MEKNLNSLIRSIFYIAVPMILSNVSAPLLGLVDTAIVGRIGTTEIGSVAIGATTFSLIFSSFVFLRICTTGYIAQSWGSKNTAEAENIIQNTISISIVCGLFVILFSIPLKDFFLLLLGPSYEIRSLAESYINIRFWSAPAVFFTYVILGSLIGSNKPFHVVTITVFTNLVNVFLDLFLGVVLGYGVIGIAIGTLISEWSGAILGIVIIKQVFPKFKLFSFNLKFSQLIKKMILSNIDFFIRTILLLTSIMLFTAIGARISDLILAVNSILILLQMFLSYGIDGFAQAAEVLVGNAYGSKNKSALKRVILITGLISFIVALLYSLVYFFLGINIVNLITNIDEVIDASKHYLPWIVISPIISFLSFHLDGVFIGAARTRVMRNAMLISFIIYLFAIILLVPVLENHGLWIAFLIFLLFRGVTLAVKLKSIISIK